MSIFDTKDTRYRRNRMAKEDFPNRLAYYQAMAEDGWILSRADPGILSEERDEVFWRGDGKDVHFDIGYKSGAHKHSDALQEYLREAEKAGYALIYQMDDMCVFRRSAATPPMHTMAELEKELSDIEEEKKKKITTVLAVILFVMAEILGVAYLVWTYSRDSNSLLTTLFKKHSFYPATLASAILIGLIEKWYQRRLKNTREAIRAGNEPDGSEYRLVMRMLKIRSLLVFLPILLPLLIY